MDWQIIGRVKSDVRTDGEPPENRSGLVIYLQQDDARPEPLEAIGFDRAASSRPDVDFNTALDESMGKVKRAKEAIEEIRGLFAGPEVLQ